MFVQVYWVYIVRYVSCKIVSAFQNLIENIAKPHAFIRISDNDSIDGVLFRFQYGTSRYGKQTQISIKFIQNINKNM